MNAHWCGTFVQFQLISYFQVKVGENLIIWLVWQTNMEIEHGAADHFLRTWCASSHWCYFQRLQCTGGKWPLGWIKLHSWTCFMVWLPGNIQIATTACPRVLSQVQSVSSTAPPCCPNMVTSCSKKNKMVMAVSKLEASKWRLNHQPSFIYIVPLEVGHYIAGALSTLPGLMQHWENHQRWFGCMWWHINGLTLCEWACMYVCAHICPSVQSWPNGPSALALLTENQWPTR